jgi:hypothetical protein
MARASRVHDTVGKASERGCVPRPHRGISYLDKQQNKKINHRVDNQLLPLEILEDLSLLNFLILSKEQLNFWWRNIPPRA